MAVYEGKKTLKDEELDNVSGGSHLSRAEVDGLVKGQILIYEDFQGVDMAKVEYLGETRDPGVIFMIECKVRILEIFHGEAIDLGYHEYLRVGDEVFLSRLYLDFPERA